MTKRLAKTIFSVRLDAGLVSRIKAMGFTLTEAIEAALREWIARRENSDDGARRG